MDETTGERVESGVHEDFYRKLRNRMREWLRKDGQEHKWAEYLMFAPDLFYTLVRLMGDPDVPAPKKARVAGAIAYFISPIDLVPEGIVGPIGYIDDIVLAAYVLEDILEGTSPEVIKRNWPGEDDVLEVISTITGVATNILGVGLLKKLLKRDKE